MRVVCLWLVGVLTGCGLWSASGGPYNGGPGGPILVVTNSANPFTEYYAEILLAEGLNCFALEGTSAIANTTLTNYDVVILGEMSLTSTQVTTLSNWVNAGGSLIAMRPDKQLTNLLGLVAGSSTISEGYVLVNTTNGPGVGIVGQTMQYHGAADRYTLGSATSLATLYSNATSATVNPAVTLRSIGTNGGQAAAFTYDLARSIVYTRQGNPAWVDQNRDAAVTTDAVVRADDLFYGATTNVLYGPATNDWVNLDKVAIPQADEQQRLLANMILYMNSDKTLLPRFWYFPHGYKAVVVMTGDDHAGAYGGSATYAARRFGQYLAASSPGGSVDDWTVPRCTAYIYVSPSPSLTNDAQAKAFETNGFEISLHVNADCSNYTPATLNNFFTNQLNQFTNAFPSLASPTTHRLHCVTVSGYTILPEVGLTLGIRLDTTYYYWPPSWITDRPGLFTGSGMPMRYATTNGNVLDVFQAPTQMTDESGQSYPYTINTLLDRALGAEGYYGAFVANMHTDDFAEPAADAIFISASDRGVPLISARQLLTWLDARNNSAISNINWSGNTQSFAINADANAKGLQAMVPVPVGQFPSAVQRGGSPIAHSEQVIKGVLYATFPALSGNYQITYAPDTNPPVVSAVSPTNAASGLSIGASVKVSFSEAMNPATLNAGTITLSNAAAGQVPCTLAYFANTAVLTPVSLLAAATTYTLRVKGGAGGVADWAGNPLAQNFVSTFTTETSPAYTLGNTNTGTLSDNIWGLNGASINAIRFLPDYNFTVLTMRAQVVGIAGHYKCAIYNDGSGQPGQLLRTTPEVSNPDEGWQSFPLDTPLALTNGFAYWLAIWSDDPDARVFYSDGFSGTLLWEDRLYGAWPQSFTQSGSSSLNYCIHAYGTGNPGAQVQLTSMTMSNGVFRFLLNGPVGSNYVIQVSSNLLSWSPFATNPIPAGGWVLITDPSTVNQSPRFYRAVAQQMSGSIIFPATSGVITSPFVITNGYIYQPVGTSLLNSGRAAYNFTITDAGTYVIQTMVNAPGGGANSFFVNIDAEPQDPYMIWDVLPLTLGFEQRTLNWRGNGTSGSSEFVPKVFTLSQGSHQLIIRGREANTLLQTITILPYP